MQQVIVILTNVPDLQCGHTMAHALVEQGMAACVNLLPAVRSVYRWQGTVEEAAEVTLLVKTTTALYRKVEAAIKAAHPYEVPEIIALPIVAGLPSYLDWVVSETNKDGDV